MCSSDLLPIYGTLLILLIAYCTKYMPYGMRYATTSMTQISSELEESAQVSGASWWTTFRRVLLPLLSPGIMSGADPGPACYGRGGTEPTVTDANLLLGRLAPDSALAGGVELDADAAAAAIGKLASELELEPLETAEGIVRLANQEMARALRVVTVERGVDPRRFALLPFGVVRPPRQ